MSSIPHCPPFLNYWKLKRTVGNDPFKAKLIVIHRSPQRWFERFYIRHLGCTVLQAMEFALEGRLIIKRFNGRTRVSSIDNVVSTFEEFWQVYVGDDVDGDVVDISDYPLSDQCVVIARVPLSNSAFRNRPNASQNCGAFFVGAFCECNRLNAPLLES